MPRQQEFIYEDWYGNNQADLQAKAGSDKHGYNPSQHKQVLDNVQIAEQVQEHIINTYNTYITNPLVRKDIEMNAKIKGTPSGKKSRPSIRPEQLGHDVKFSGYS
eukprot:5238703-Heterocapsa_arctica.AAC.1